MRTSSGNSALIGRRRGTGAASRGFGNKNLVLNQKSLLVLAALCATIFSMGLILGTHIFGSPQTVPNSSSGVPSNLKDADVSPLVAASAKIAPSDIQNLILESAKAEAIEKKEHQQEEEARRHGDKKLALHLRGALAPGDPNYNPHHHVDDVLDDDGNGVEQGGGDGAMYAAGGDQDKGGDKKTEASGREDMHNHFAEALKNELHHAKEGKDHLVETMHEQLEHALENEKKAVDSIKSGVGHLKGRVVEVAEKIAPHGLRGFGAGDGHDNIGKNNISAAAGGSSHYPYMKAPVPEDYDFQQYVPLGGDRFVEYKDGDSPYEITQTLREQSDELARSRRVHVLNAMKHVWKSYKEFTFGYDEIHPSSKKGTNNWGGMGTTLVDSLDTLWLMGLKDEFWEARDWVRDNLSHDHPREVSAFETTIRSLGGLLSAYDLSHDEAFLTKAEDLGSRLVKAFNSPNGLPYGSINLNSGTGHNFGWTSQSYLLAEVGTNQIEYRYLSRATGKPEYAEKSEKVFDILRAMMPDNGLYPIYIKDGTSSAKSNGPPVHFGNDKISFGAMGDSAYEYMLKMWQQGGRKEQKYRDMWDKAMDGVHDALLQKSTPNGLTFIADKVHGRLDLKMDHLVCFMGGALALGAYTDPQGLDSARAQRDLKTAKALTYTCYQMYARSKTGISPEYVNFNDDSGDFTVPRGAPFYILRPETVEAFYYLSQLTGDPIYREWGWEVFQSIEKYCKLPYGYGSLKDVNNPSLKPEDRMESFFLAETLKYLYLLFDPDSEIDLLNKHVFNTEAHPLKIFE